MTFIVILLNSINEFTSSLMIVEHGFLLKAVCHRKATLTKPVRYALRKNFANDFLDIASSVRGSWVRAHEFGRVATACRLLKLSLIHI